LTKREKCDQFGSDSTRGNPWGIVYKISRDKINQQFAYELKDNNNRLIIEAQDVAEHLMTNLFPEDRPQKDSDLHKEVRLLSEHTKHIK